MNNLVHTYKYEHSHVVTSPCVHIQLPVLSQRRRTRLIESDAKCRHLKKLTCKGTLQQVFICLRLRISPPPLHIVYVNTVYLFTDGRGGGGELSLREGQRRNSSQSWVEKANMIDCISSLSTLINTCRKVPLQGNFLDDNILPWCLLVNVEFHITMIAAKVFCTTVSTRVKKPLYSIKSL
jgi:hypothetical protein